MTGATTLKIDGLPVRLSGSMTGAEVHEYVERGLAHYGDQLRAMVIVQDGDEVELEYILRGRPFERIRRITGFQRYGGDKTERRCMANQCIVCGAEMPEGDQVCTRCRERTAFNRNASQNINDRIRELEAEIRMLRVVKKAMGGRDDTWQSIFW